MRERDIRSALLSDLNAKFPTDTRIIQEMGLCRASARIDVAVINGSLHGYEIKSEQDTLERLPFQKAIYNRVMDFVNVVAGGRHLAKLRRKIPGWWGIFEAVPADEGAMIHEIRPGSRNPSVDANAVAQLLWREEALSLLEAFGLAAGVRSKSRRVLADRLADSVPLDVLSDAIRSILKVRENWRSEPSRISDDDSSLPPPTSSDSPEALRPSNPQYTHLPN